MKQYFGDNWQAILAANNLGDFDALWDLKTDWFEPPNIRRGGWSGVIKIDLDTPQGKVGIFIKRQENHSTKTPRHPINGRPTFEREFRNILRLQKHNIPTLEPVYFAKRLHNGDLQAILITKELTGYTALDSEQFLTEGSLINNTIHRERLLIAVADTLRTLHRHRLQHNCFYLKHIFVKPDGDGWDIKIIDLEKLKRSWLKKDATFRDLYTLQRDATSWSRKDHVKLFKAYNQEYKLSDQSKTLWRSIKNKVLSKRK